jgi:hypothetical protein
MFSRRRYGDEETGAVREKHGRAGAAVASMFSRRRHGDEETGAVREKRGRTSRPWHTR